MSNNCDICEGDLYYIKDGQQYTCKCVLKNQLRRKFSNSGIGAHNGLPSEKLRQPFSDHEDDLFPYLYVKLNGSWQQKKFNSVLGYLFVKYAWNMNTQYHSMNSLREKFKDNDYVTEFDSDLLAVSYNLDGVFKGIGADKQWARDQVRSILQRTIRFRLQNRKPMWFFGYRLSQKFENDVEKMLIENNFHVLNLREEIN